MPSKTTIEKQPRIHDMGMRSSPDIVGERSQGYDDSTKCGFVRIGVAAVGSIVSILDFVPIN